MLSLKDIRQVARKLPGAKKTAAARPKPAPVTQPPVIRTDDEDDVPLGVHGLLAASEKLLAVNRGLDEPDERDSYGYKRIWSVDKHLAERIKLDAGKVRNNLMRNAARLKSLKGAYPFLFDGYSNGLVIGDPGMANPLSSPLEEINPMHILEQARRVTQMGPGGIGSDEAITESAQGVHSSQFGFVSTVEGPESERSGIDVRLAYGARLGSDGKIYQQFRNRRTEQLEWLSPDITETKVIRLPD